MPNEEGGSKVEDAFTVSSGEPNTVGIFPLGIVRKQLLDVDLRTGST